jgi:hypothetical protein
MSSTDQGGKRRVSENAWSSHQVNQNIATSIKARTQDGNAIELKIVAPITEVGHNFPQGAAPHRTPFTSVLQRVQVSLAKTIPRLPQTSFIN